MSRFFRKDFHHHGQSPNLLSSRKFLLSGDEVHTDPPVLASRNTAVPAKYLAPRDSFIAFTLGQGTNSRLEFLKSCGAFHWAAPLPAFSKFPKASFSCLFLFTFLRSTLFGAWFGLLAAFLGKKCGGARAGCPHNAVSWKFPSLEITLCFSKAWSQPSSTKQPGFFTASGSLATDLCKT